MTAFNADDRYSSHAPARISKAIPSPSAGNTLEGVAWNTPALPSTKASTSQPRREAAEATATRLRASVWSVERCAYNMSSPHTENAIKTIADAIVHAMTDGR